MTDTQNTAAIDRPTPAGARNVFTSNIKLTLRVPAKLRNLELVLLLVRLRDQRRRDRARAARRARGRAP